MTIDGADMSTNSVIKTKMTEYIMFGPKIS